MAKAILLLGLMGFGCALSEPVLKVGEEGDAAIIVVRIDPGLEVTALAFESEPFISVPTEGHEQVYVLRYRCSLEALGLVAGTLAQSAGTGRPLPPSRRVGRAQKNDLIPIDVWPEALANIRIDSPLPMPSHCAQLRADPILSPTGGVPSIRVLLPIDPDQALAYDDNGDAFKITASGISRWTELSTSAGYLGGFLDNNGKVTLVGNGRTAVGSLDGGFVRGATIADASRFRLWIDGDPEGDELFLTGDDHALHRYKGGHWTLWKRSPFESYVIYGGVLWLGSRHAWAIQVEDFAITEYEDEMLSQHPLPEVLLREQPSMLAEIDGFGRIVGTEDGSLFIEDDDGLKQRFFTPTWPVGVIVPIGNGLLFGGRNGTLTQFYPDKDVCPLLEYTPGGIRYLIPMGDGFLTISNQSIVGMDYFHILRRTDSGQAVCEEP